MQHPRWKIFSFILYSIVQLRVYVTVVIVKIFRKNTTEQLVCLQLNHTVTTIAL